MLHFPRAGLLALTALLALVLAVPAAAAPGQKGDRHPTKDRAKGNPVAHCLEDKHRDDDTVDEPVEETATAQVAVETTTAPPADETSTPHPKKDKKRGIRDCVHAALKDVERNPHGESIVAVVADGIATGYPDATFKPNKPVSRAQMATFLTRALDLAAEAPSGFGDVAGNPHAEAVAAIVEAGITAGYADGTFKPNRAVTRAQLAAFLTRALDLAAGDGDSSSDVEGNPHAEAIDAVVDAGIAHGFADGTFKPNKPVTRGQMASFLARAFGLV